MKKDIKVLVGLSGGVDSAIAAYLLIKEGYDVSGCFMRNWDAMANNDILGNPTINDSQCPQEKDYDDAKATANSLGIPLLRADFIKEYWDNVFTYFLKEYEIGRTPNPDIFCNKFIKFDAFLKFAKENGFDYIAMGHYAKRELIDNVFYLCKCKDQNKDQTYFLSQLNEQQISSCLFPLGDIEKTEVRKIAHELKLNIADKKDSTGVCFIGERNFKKFLENYLPAKNGDIVDIETKRNLGIHNGVLYYTIGQRHGLGIGGISHEDSLGWFVVRKDVKNNILYVAKGDENKYLMSDYCIVRHLNFVNDKFPLDEQHVGCKFRYRQKDNPVTIVLISKDTIKVTYDNPVKAVTSGQSAVFYDNDIMIGGGIIEEVYSHGQRVD